MECKFILVELLKAMYGKLGKNQKLFDSMRVVKYFNSIC